MALNTFSARSFRAQSLIPLTHYRLIDPPVEPTSGATYLLSPARFGATAQSLIQFKATTVRTVVSGKDMIDAKTQQSSIQGKASVEALTGGSASVTGNNSGSIETESSLQPTVKFKAGR